MPVHKQLVAMVISLSLVFSVTPVIAAEKQSGSKEVTYSSISMFDSLVKILPELKGYQIKSITMGTDGHHNEVMHIEIGKSDEKKDRAELTVDLITGEIIQYTGYKESNDIPEKLAIKKANEFMKKLVGNDSKNYAITTTNIGMVGYSKKINGIPFLHANYSILLDSNGKIVTFSKGRMGEKFKISDFPHPSKAISEEEARSILPDQWQDSKLRLVYWIGKDDKPHLVYEALSEYYYPAKVDAISGELMEQD